MAQHSRHTWSGIGYINGRIEASGGFVQMIAAQINARSLLTALAAVLLSQASLPGGAMPFAVPYAAALLLMEKQALPALIGSALGLLIRWEPITWINGWQLGAALLLMLVIRRGWDWKPWKVSLAAGAVMLPPLPFVASRVDMLIVCLSGAIAAGVLTPVYIRSLLTVSSPKQTLSNDDKLCCLLVAAAFALGGLWMGVGTYSAGYVITALVIYLVAWAAGPGLALPAGVLMGLVMMTTGASFDVVAILAVLGGIAGMMRGTRRVLPVLGGALVCSLVAFTQGGMEQVIGMLPPILGGGILFLAMPGIWLDALIGMLEPEAQQVLEPDAAASSYILASYAEAMTGMARALPMPDQQTDALPVELLACRLCTGCQRQQSCWDEKQRETMDLLDGILLACAEGPNEKEIEQAANMMGCLRAQEAYGLAIGLVTAKRHKEKDDALRMEARTWALEQIKGQSRALFALSERMGEDWSEAMRARSDILAAMPALRGRPDALAVCTLGGKLHIWLDVQSGEGHMGRLEAALGEAVGKPMERLETATLHNALLFVERPRLRLSIGRASIPIAGEEICGDSTLAERLDAGRYVLALSDGMGSGRSAHGESRAALDLLHKVLQAGYGRNDALRTVNGLLVACRGDEMFATLDLCVMDMDTGEAALDKLGACPSFLLRAGKCKRIDGDSLPMGILDAVRPRALAARMQPGDMLLMVSDGVMDAFGGEESAFLRALGGLAAGGSMPTVQRFADTLLRRAFERSGGQALDDMTVLAAKVEEGPAR